jgi:hypothetical protein
MAAMVVVAAGGAAGKAG